MVAAAVWPLSQVSDSGGSGRGWQGLAGVARTSAEEDRWVKMFFWHRLCSFIVRKETSFPLSEILLGISGGGGWLRRLENREKGNIY